jgi:hypothetical protein
MTMSIEGPLNPSFPPGPGDTYRVRQNSLIPKWASWLTQRQMASCPTAQVSSLPNLQEPQLTYLFSHPLPAMALSVVRTCVTTYWGQGCLHLTDGGSPFLGVYLSHTHTHTHTLALHNRCTRLLQETQPEPQKPPAQAFPSLPSVT